MLPNIRTCNCCLASSGMSQAAQHPHGGGFASAIGTEKTKDRSRRDRKRKVLHGMDIAKTLAQTVEHDYRFVHLESLLR
jgi:hypothetical protein